MLSYDITLDDCYDFIYSIDNLRICFNLEDNYDNFLSILKSYDTDNDDLPYNVRYFQSHRIYSFEHLFTFSSNDKTLSFTIGFSEKGRHNFKFDGFIDFNPNKVCFWDTFLIVFQELHTFGTDFTLKRYDLAIDIPFQRDFVKLIKDRRSYHYLKDRSVTEYLGKRSNHNFLKIYDKTVESKLDYDLTRIEITVDPEETINFPDIQILKSVSNIDSSDLKDTDKVLFELLAVSEDPFFYINRLGRKQKEKFKKLFSTGFFKFNPDLSLIIRLVQKVEEKYIYNHIEYPYALGFVTFEDDLPFDN